MYFLLILFLIFTDTSLQAQNSYALEVFKDKRTLNILKDGKIFKSYQIALGGQPKGTKHFEGDQKTPEGQYFISGKNPHSQFHKSLRISYPNSGDQIHARVHKKNPGGDIMIHGLGKGFSHLGRSHVLYNWTLGCIAVTNQEIEEIYKLIPNNTPIYIYP